MNLRHAAALVVWYLMMPPFDRTTLTYRTDLPISEWDNLRAMNSPWDGEFDSENQCEDFRMHIVAWLVNRKPKYREDAEKPVTLTYRQFKLGECIASNDPRLKQK